MFEVTPKLLDQLAFPAKGLRGVLVRGVGGGWGDESGSSRGISGPADLLWLLANRATADAVIVGAGTLLREQYRPIRIRPEWLEWRRSSHLADAVGLVAMSRKPEDVAQSLEVANLVLTTDSIAALSNDSRVVGCGDLETADLAAGLRAVRERGWHRLVHEGGPRLLDAFAAVGELDQLALTDSPRVATAHTAFANLEEFIEKHQGRRLAEDEGFKFSLHGELPDWRQLLDPAAFQVLRKHGTEPAFSADYEKQPAPGYYTCAGCGSRLFDADTQFDARCGWPAFWRPSADDAIELLTDRSWGMTRTEVRCRACGGHLGHVFAGEGWGFPTDQRYCINAVSIRRVGG